MPAVVGPGGDPRLIGLPGLAVLRYSCAAGAGPSSTVPDAPGGPRQAARRGRGWLPVESPPFTPDDGEGAGLGAGPRPCRTAGARRRSPPGGLLGGGRSASAEVVPGRAKDACEHGQGEHQQPGEGSHPAGEPTRRAGSGAERFPHRPGQEAGRGGPRWSDRLTDRAPVQIAPDHGLRANLGRADPAGQTGAVVDVVGVVPAARARGGGARPGRAASTPPMRTPARISVTRSAHIRPQSPAQPPRPVPAGTGRRHGGGAVSAR